jgi:hypothetical protein
MEDTNLGILVMVHGSHTHRSRAQCGSPNFCSQVLVVGSITTNLGEFVMGFLASLWGLGKWLKMVPVFVSA